MLGCPKWRMERKRRAPNQSKAGTLWGTGVPLEASPPQAPGRERLRDAKSGSLGVKNHWSHRILLHERERRPSDGWERETEFPSSRQEGAWARLQTVYRKRKAAFYTMVWTEISISYLCLKNTEESLSECLDGSCSYGVFVSFLHMSLRFCIIYIFTWFYNKKYYLSKASQVSSVSTPLILAWSFPGLPSGL